MRKISNNYQMEKIKAITDMKNYRKFCLNIGNKTFDNIFYYYEIV